MKSPGTPCIEPTPSCLRRVKRYSATVVVLDMANAYDLQVYVGATSAYRTGRTGLSCLQCRKAPSVEPCSAKLLPRPSGDSRHKEGATNQPAVLSPDKMKWSSHQPRYGGQHPQSHTTLCSIEPPLRPSFYAIARATFHAVLHPTETSPEIKVSTKLGCSLSAKDLIFSTRYLTHILFNIWSSVLLVRCQDHGESE